MAAFGEVILDHADPGLVPAIREYIDYKNIIWYNSMGITKNRFP